MTEKPQLSLVTPADDPNMNVLLYGPPKSGKTMGAASAEGPILYLNADRPNATRHAHRKYDFDEAKVEGLQTFNAALAVLDDYHTIVVDTVADVYRIVLEELSGKSMAPTLQQYRDTGTHLERFCRLLCEKPVNLVLVAHEIVSQDEETGVYERLPYTGTNKPVFAAKLMAMVDVIGYTGVVAKEDGAEEYMAQLINSRGRRGGDRFGVLGRNRTLNLQEWEALMRKAHDQPQPLLEGAA